jgi:hypothetical protein
VPGRRYELDGAVGRLHLHHIFVMVMTQRREHEPTAPYRLRPCRVPGSELVYLLVFVFLYPCKRCVTCL